MRWITVLLIGLLVSAGCGSAEEKKEPDVQSSSHEPLSGGYVVTNMTEKGAARQPAAGSTILLEFSDGQLNLNGGCNAMFASVVQEGDELDIDPMASTQMGCPSELMEQDSWLARVLHGKVRIDQSEGVRLISGDVEIELARHTVNKRALSGTTWHLDTLIAGRSTSSVHHRSTAYITFTDDKSIQTDSGCNTGGGKVKVTADTLTFEPRMTTLIGCKQEWKRDAEEAFDKVLQGRVSYIIEGDRLTILTAEAGLGFTAE